MADITMCMTKTCPVKESCYRYTAKANEYRQAYSDFSHLITVGHNGYECIEFVPAYEISHTTDAKHT